MQNGGSSSTGAASRTEQKHQSGLTDPHRNGSAGIEVAAGNPIGRFVNAIEAQNLPFGPYIRVVNRSVPTESASGIDESEGVQEPHFPLK
jgi:hypothetical protein